MAMNHFDPLLCIHYNILHFLIPAFCSCLAHYCSSKNLSHLSDQCLLCHKFDKILLDNLSRIIAQSCLILQVYSFAIEMMSAISLFGIQIIVLDL